MNEDRFLERLRGDARQLRYEPADVAVTRVAARVRERIAQSTQPTIAELIAAWFRPLTASLTAIALVAALGLTLVERDQSVSFGSDPVEVSMGGDVFSVVE